SPWKRRYAGRRHGRVTPSGQLSNDSALAVPADAGIDVEIVDLPGAAASERRQLDPRRGRPDDRQERDCQAAATRAHLSGRRPALARRERREVGDPQHRVQKPVPDDAYAQPAVGAVHILPEHAEEELVLAEAHN